MKIGEFLYFAPGLTFAELDLNESELPKQFARRVDGFYLAPAAILCKEGHGFGAALLTMCAIDALARVEHPGKDVGERFKNYVETRLPSFRTGDFATVFYSAFRNGIVHEARAKDGAEIVLGSSRTVELAPGGIRIDALRLLHEVSKALSEQIGAIEKDFDRRRKFREYVLNQFSVELAGVVAER